MSNVQQSLPKDGEVSAIFSRELGPPLPGRCPVTYSWVAVMERNKSFYIGETPFFLLYTYIHIYIYIHPLW